MDLPVPHRDALASLNQSLAAIDVMIRGGKGQGGRLVGMAQEARHAAETLVRVMLVRPAKAAKATDGVAQTEKA